MITLALALVMLAIATYFDIKIRGTRRWIPWIFCGVGIISNLLTGSTLNASFIVLLIFCVLVYAASFSKIYGRNDGAMFCAIILTTPYIGVIPVIFAIAPTIITGLIVQLTLCRYRNSNSPHPKIKINSKKESLLRLLAHVNNGEKFVVPAIVDDKQGGWTVNMRVDKKRIGKTNAPYVVPIIPLMPIFAAVYIVFVIITT
jgi:hypothetical protein